MCIVQLLPAGNPLAVNKYIIHQRQPEYRNSTGNLKVSLNEVLLQVLTLIFFPQGQNGLLNTPGYHS